MKRLSIIAECSCVFILSLGLCFSAKGQLASNPMVVWSPASVIRSPAGSIEVCRDILIIYGTDSIHWKDASVNRVRSLQIKNNISQVMPQPGWSSVSYLVVGDSSKGTIQIIQRQTVTIRIHLENENAEDIMVEFKDAKQLGSSN